MKKSLISSHFAHHRPRDKLVTYYCTAYDLDVQRQNMAREEVPHMEMGGMQPRNTRRGLWPTPAVRNCS